MVEPLMEEAAAAATAATATGQGCFADELVLLDFTSDPLAAAGELPHPAFFFQDLFDPSVDCLPGLPAGSGGGGEEEEEEELEWLANKDAFPGLETSFEVPTRSLSSSGSGWSGSRGGAAAGGAGTEGVSTVSPLAAAASFSAPARPRSKGRTPRRTALTPLSSPQPVPAAGARKAGAGAQRRRCRHCQSEETPQWRAGPEGPKTLCNACGVRYKSGRLVPEYRPARSPTFSAAMHSNSHRRILEMRREKPSGERRRSTWPPLPPPAGVIS